MRLILLVASSVFAFLRVHACDVFKTCASDIEYSTGPFDIVYDQENSMIEVYDGASLVWFTGSSNFASAARVSESVEQNGGIFVITNTVVDTCNEMSVSNHGSAGGGTAGSQNVVYFNGTICNHTSFFLTFQAQAVTDENQTWSHLRLNLSIPDDSSYNQLWLTYGCAEDEHFYGFGAQYSKFDMKGYRLPMFLSEQGVGRGLEPLTAILDAISKGAGGTWYTTYTHVPFYITSYHRGFLLESPQYSVFDLTQKTSIRLEINNHFLQARIIAGKSPKEVITSYTAYSGRMKSLPEWLNKGAVVGMQGGTNAVLQMLSHIKQVVGSADDIASFWLQDWTGQRNFTSSARDIKRVGLWWNWEVDSTHYPDWMDFISHLQAENITVLTYINALLSDVSERGTPFQHNYWQEAINNDYFVRNGSGDVWVGYTKASLVDLSNPSAYKWYKEIIIQNMLASGVKGWMCDFGESLPLDAKLWQSQDAREWHTRYPEVWGQLNREAIAEAKERGLSTGDDVVYFMRSGATFSATNTRLFWLGDQTVTWDEHDGLTTIIIGLLSSGLSGYSLQHSDIGGYTAIDLKVIKYLRSKELLMRWCELAAFTSMYRSHLGTLPTENWQFYSDNETMLHYFKMARLYKSFSSYRASLMTEAEQKGIPLVRPMFMEYPDDNKMYSIDLTHQFMFGSELLVAPVYKPHQSTVHVFLPTNSSWIHLWTNKEYTGEGDWVVIEAPMGQPCALRLKDSAAGEEIVASMYKHGLLPV